MDQEEILNLYADLERKVPEDVLGEIEGLRKKYLSEETPFWELGLQSVYIEHYRLSTQFNDRNEGIEIIDPLIDAIENMLKERGYRQETSTGQEHWIYGSSDINSEDPYIVHGIIREENLSVEEARKARQLEGFGNAGMLVKNVWGYEPQVDEILIFPLVDLDDEGRTLYDPPLYRVNSIEDYMLNENFEVLREGFPKNMQINEAPFRRK
jgi:hypothetical protein